MAKRSRKHKPIDHRIMLADRGYIQGRRAEFEAAIRKAFENASFNRTDQKLDSSRRRFTVDDVVKSALDSHTSRDENRRAVVALGEEDKILGAVFHVPIKNPGDAKLGDLGWFFTSPELGVGSRIAVGDSIMESAHDVNTRPPRANR